MKIEIRSQFVNFKNFKGSIYNFGPKMKIEIRCQFVIFKNLWGKFTIFGNLLGLI